MKEEFYSLLKSEMKTTTLLVFQAAITVILIMSAMQQDDFVNNMLPHAMPTWLVYDPAQFESIEQFLTMYPPSRVPMSRHPWIYVGKTSGHLHPGNVQELLREWGSFSETRRPSQQLLLYLAEKHKVLAGKWMIYANHYEVDDAWDRIAKLVSKGKLGVAAKVSPYSPSQMLHCICVYNNNFLDKKEIKEVRQQLRDIGFTTMLEYKPDAYTHLGIYPGNKWHIPEGLYRE